MRTTSEARSCFDAWPSWNVWRNEIRRGQVQALSRGRIDHHSDDPRLANDVLPCVPLQVAQCLLRHVVHVSHVVFEIRDAPPEADGVREIRRPVDAERGTDRPLCLRRLELLLR